MKKYVFKVFYFFVLILPFLIGVSFDLLRYLKYQHQYKKYVIRFYDYFIMGGFLSGGFCPVPTCNIINHELWYNNTYS